MQIVLSHVKHFLDMIHGSVYLLEKKKERKANGVSEHCPKYVAEPTGVESKNAFKSILLVILGDFKFQN